jgi:hypothetical protein
MRDVNLSEGWTPAWKPQHTQPLQVVNLSEGWVLAVLNQNVLFLFCLI